MASGDQDCCRLTRRSPRRAWATVSLLGVFVLFGKTLEESNPRMQKTFEGPAAGVGQSFSWSGQDAGTGTLAIIESVDGQKVGMKLQFVKPMASTATCTLTVAATPAGSLVTWSMEGHHNFIGRALGLLMGMDRMLGADLEKGLDRLKSLAEGRKGIPPAAARTAATE